MIEEKRGETKEWTNGEIVFWYDLVWYCTIAYMVIEKERKPTAITITRTAAKMLLTPSPSWERPTYELPRRLTYIVLLTAHPRADKVTVTMIKSSNQSKTQPANFLPYQLVFGTTEHDQLGLVEGTHHLPPPTHYLSISIVILSTRGKQWSQDLTRGVLINESSNNQPSTLNPQLKTCTQCRCNDAVLPFPTDLLHQ